MSRMQQKQFRLHPVLVEKIGLAMTTGRFNSEASAWNYFAGMGLDNWLKSNGLTLNDNSNTTVGDVQNAG